MAKRVLEMDQQELHEHLLRIAKEQDALTYDVIRVVFDNGTRVELTPARSETASDTAHMAEKLRSRLST